MEKLTPKFTSIPKNDAEKKILDRISTREKAEEWRDELEQDSRKLWNFDNKSKYAYRKKIEQIQIVLNRFAMEDERVRIAKELAHLSKSVPADYSEKSKALDTAKGVRDKARAKLSGLEARHAALCADFEDRKKKAFKNEQDAQEEFNRAVSGTDEDSQVTTAETLSAKKAVTAAVNSPDGPIALQINAFAREVSAAMEAFESAERAVMAATALHLKAAAACSILEYDKQILPLFDVWQRAHFAVIDVRNSVRRLSEDSDLHRILGEFSPEFDIPPVLPTGYVKQDFVTLNIDIRNAPDIGILGEQLPEPKYEDVGDRKKAEDAHSRRLNKQEKPGDLELVNEYMTHMQAFPNEPFHSKLLAK